MDRQKKKNIIQSHQKHDKDTGSPSVQIMILTERILEVTQHLEVHKKDNHSRRGLLKMVENRKKLLRYLKDIRPEEYEQIIGIVEKTKAESAGAAGRKATVSKTKSQAKKEKREVKKEAKKSAAKKPAAKAKKPVAKVKKPAAKAKKPVAKKKSSK